MFNEDGVSRDGGQTAAKLHLGYFVRPSQPTPLPQHCHGLVRLGSSSKYFCLPLHNDSNSRPFVPHIAFFFLNFVFLYSDSVLSLGTR